MIVCVAEASRLKSGSSGQAGTDLLTLTLKSEVASILASS